MANYGSNRVKGDVEMEPDFGYEIIDSEYAIECLKFFENKKVYVRMIVNTTVGYSLKEICTFYSPMKICSVSTETAFIYLYGEGENRLLINQSSVTQYEKSEDTLHIILNDNGCFSNIYLKYIGGE